MGILPRVEELLVPGVTADDLKEAFWQACHGGQRRAAELLLNRGADPSAVPGYSEQRDDTPARPEYCAHLRVEGGQLRAVQQEIATHTGSDRHGWDAADAAQ